MAQTHVARQSPKSANIEYTVYTFQRNGAGAKTQPRWQKQDTFNDMGQAVTKAESLFGSGAFCKVEIKQKYTDPKNNRIVDTTLKVFEGREKKSISTSLLLFLAAAGGLIAFLLAYFLGK